MPVPCDDGHEAHAHEHQAAPNRAARDSVDAWFVDLFVRCNNGRAISMYEKMGYSVYRRVVECVALLSPPPDHLANSLNLAIIMEWKVLALQETN